MRSGNKFICLFMALVMTAVFMTQGYTSATVSAAQKTKTSSEIKKAVYLSGLDLSKKKGEYYTTKKEEYIDTSRFILYLQKGVEVPVNIIELINHIMNRIEETTSYNFDVKNRLIYVPDMRDELVSYFDTAETLKKLNHDYPKVEIVVAKQNYGIYSVGGAGILISPEYIRYMNENVSYMIHELLHIAWQRYGVYMGSSLAEGFAEYYTTAILENDKVFTNTYNAFQRESRYENIINDKTAEDLFLNCTAGSGSDKLGFRITCYILENYGTASYRKVHEKVTKLYTDVGNVPMSIVAKALKSELSKDFFKEFAKWYSQNRERFGDEDMSKYGDWYIVDDALIKYFGNDPDVTIPDTVNRLSREAFMDCATLSSVKLPDKITEIGATAFYDCIKLKEIVIPDSVTFLGECAFEGCTSLKKVVLPKGLTTINSSTFMGCRSLTEIKLPAGLTSIGSNAFSDCSSLKSIHLPDTLVQIGMIAFSNCTGLEKIVLPKRLTEIPNSLFSGCKNLKSIVIPDKVTSIGDFAFWGNDNLKSITIPKSVKRIGENTFLQCSKLTIYGTKGSYAESYAKKHKIPFKAVK